MATTVQQCAEWRVKACVCQRRKAELEAEVDMPGADMSTRRDAFSSRSGKKIKKPHDTFRIYTAHDLVIHDSKMDLTGFVADLPANSSGVQYD